MATRHEVIAEYVAELEERMAKNPNLTPADINWVKNQIEREQLNIRLDNTTSINRYGNGPLWDAIHNTLKENQPLWVQYLIYEGALNVIAPQGMSYRYSLFLSFFSREAYRRTKDQREAINRAANMACFGVDSPNTVSVDYESDDDFNRYLLDGKPVTETRAIFFHAYELLGNEPELIEQIWAIYQSNVVSKI